MSGDIRSTIRDFIAARFSREEPIPDDQDLFALGFVNSLFALELLTFIETRFAVSIPDNELRPEVFHTIDAMVALVERLTDHTPAQPASEADPAQRSEQPAGEHA
jgi:acyl carrier protein